MSSRRVVPVRVMLASSSSLAHRRPPRGARTIAAPHRRIKQLGVVIARHEHDPVARLQEARERILDRGVGVEHRVQPTDGEPLAIVAVRSSSSMFQKSMKSPLTTSWSPRCVAARR